MARLYGFRSSLTQRQTQAQNLAVVFVFVLLAIPLGYSLLQIAWEAQAQQIVRGEIEETFDSRSQIFALDTDFNSEPIKIGATVFTPRLRPDAQNDIERALERRLGEPVDFVLVQDEVGNAARAAEQAQLSAAREREEAAARARIDALATRLALAAGVDEGDVTIDRTRRRATVRAQRLAGASVAVYRGLEERIQATEPDWTIELLPPAGILPSEIGFQEDGPTLNGAQALSTIEWAANRVDIPIVLIGNAQDLEKATAILAQRGVTVSVREEGGPLRAEWGQLSVLP